MLPSMPAPAPLQAAPGYEMAKRIIKLVSAVADKVRQGWLPALLLGLGANAMQRLGSADLQSWD